MKAVIVILVSLTLMLCACSESEKPQSETIEPFMGAGAVLWDKHYYDWRQGLRLQDAILVDEFYVMAGTHSPGYALFGTDMDGNGALISKLPGSQRKRDRISGLTSADDGYFLYGNGWGDGHRDIPFLIRTNRTGTELWRKEYPRSGQAKTVSKIFALDNGDLLMTGTVTGYPSNGIGMKTDAFFQRLTQHGETLWELYPQNEYGHDSIRDVVKLDAGFLAVGSYRMSSYSFHAQNLLIRISDTGEILWRKTVLDDKSLFGLRIMESGAAGFTVFAQSIDRSIKYERPMSAVLIDFDRDGQEKQRRAFPLHFTVSHILKAPNDQFILGGQILPEAALPKANAKQTDLVVMGIRPNGEALWQTVLEHEHTDQMMDMLIGADQNLMIVSQRTHTTPSQSKRIESRLIKIDLSRPDPDVDWTPPSYDVTTVKPPKPPRTRSPVQRDDFVGFSASLKFESQTPRSVADVCQSIYNTLPVDGNKLFTRNETWPATPNLDTALKGVDLNPAKWTPVAEADQKSIFFLSTRLSQDHYDSGGQFVKKKSHDELAPAFEKEYEDLKSELSYEQFTPENSDYVFFRRGKNPNPMNYVHSQVTYQGAKVTFDGWRPPMENLYDHDGRILAIYASGRGVILNVLDPSLAPDKGAYKYLYGHGNRKKRQSLGYGPFRRLEGCQIDLELDKQEP